MKNKIKNLLLLLGVIIGCVSTTSVYAQGATLTMNKSGYFWMRTSPNESTHSWYTQDYYFGDRVAYCIEPGVPEELIIIQLEICLIPIILVSKN